MGDQEIYQKFMEYMNNPLWEFTESEHLMPMIKAFLTPDEAEFLTGFPQSSRTLEQIADIKNMDPDELLPIIKAHCRKGTIYEGMRGDSVRYRLWTAVEMFVRPAFWADEVEETAKAMAPHSNKYYMDGWYDQKKPFPHPELRTIPISQTVESPTGFMPFEDVMQVVENYEYYTVSQCPCRARHNLDPDYQDSPFPMEVCLHFNELGHYIVDNGLGREITKEETLEILKKSADAGLVHGVANVEETPDTICNCDLEYCTYFKPYHQLGFDKSHEPSNYLVSTTPNTCKACGLCVKRCPMDALQLKFSTEATNKFRKAVVVQEENCIGCGVCVHKCKAKAITLKRRETTTQPPKTVKDLVNLNAMAALSAKGLMDKKN
ncbi:MAG: 4Fe-4S dicluster domain-containing protein [Deltaproteobacteria bacterium]|nr:4Fe-4S dicluster domain-containing protein [Deltaproteobacteria bacterium]